MRSQNILRRALPILAWAASTAHGHAGRLWYAQPGNDIHDAIPVGNGRLGALVYGHVDEERISLNEDSIWSGGFANRVNPNSLEALGEVRRFMDNDQLSAANDAYLDGIAAKPDQQRMYQPAGQLIISTGHSSDGIQGYNRSLDLSTSVASVAYESDGVQYTREAVGNYPTGVLAFRFAADQPGSVSLTVTLERDEGVFSTEVEGDSVLLSGHGTDDENYTFVSGLRIVSSGGVYRHNCRAMSLRSARGTANARSR